MTHFEGHYWSFYKRSYNSGRAGGLMIVLTESVWN